MCIILLKIFIYYFIRLFCFCIFRLQFLNFQDQFTMSISKIKNFSLSFSMIIPSPLSYYITISDSTWSTLVSQIVSRKNIMMVYKFLVHTNGPHFILIWNRHAICTWIFVKVINNCYQNCPSHLILPKWRTIIILGFENYILFQLFLSLR